VTWPRPAPAKEGRYGEGRFADLIEANAEMLALADTVVMQV
jgi:hypothetical protein